MEDDNHFSAENIKKISVTSKVTIKKNVIFELSMSRVKIILK